MSYTLQGSRDFFAINYGMGGHRPEVWANRIKVGPMHDCATCRFEEFFLSSWAVGDPAMVVDIPANAVDPKTNQIKTGPKATKASLSRRSEQRLPQLHGRPREVPDPARRHQHQPRAPSARAPVAALAQRRQEQLPRQPDDQPRRRRTRSTTPTHGSGNKNKTVGDAIFHCHFYPHFAQGMWSLWRVHDVFEGGTAARRQQRPVAGFNRALPGRRDCGRHADSRPRAAADAADGADRRARPGSSRSNVPRFDDAVPGSAPRWTWPIPTSATVPASRSSFPASPGSARRIRRSTSRRTRPTPANPFLNGGLPRFLALKSRKPCVGAQVPTLREAQSLGLHEVQRRAQGDPARRSRHRRREDRDEVPRARDCTTPSCPTASPATGALGLRAERPAADPRRTVRRSGGPARRHAGLSREQAAVPDAVQGGGHPARCGVQQEGPALSAAAHDRRSGATSRTRSRASARPSRSSSAPTARRSSSSGSPTWCPTTTSSTTSRCGRRPTSSASTFTW